MFFLFVFFVFSFSLSPFIINHDHIVVVRRSGKTPTLAKHEFTPAILFLFGLRIIHSVGGEKCSFARDSEPMRLLKTSRSLSVYILKCIYFFL